MANRKIKVPNAKKEVECLQGSPCETNYVRFKVINTNANRDVEVNFDPEAEVEGISITLSTVGNVVTKEIPIKNIKCSFCEKLSADIRGSLGKWKHLTPAQFEEKHGQTREGIYQQILNINCTNSALDPNRFADYGLKCNGSFRFQTGKIIVTLTGRMNFVSYGNDCVPTAQPTIVKTITIGEMGPYSFTIKASQVATISATKTCGKTPTANLGVVLDCPCYDGNVVCGACWYEKSASFNRAVVYKPVCMDLSQKNMTLSDFPQSEDAYADPSGSAPSPLFTEIKNIREQAAKKLITMVEQGVKTLAAQLTAEAQALAKNNCGSSYSISSISADFTKKKIT